MKQTFKLLLCVFMLFTGAKAFSYAQSDWALYDHFVKNHYDSGMVLQYTSEGQSYTSAEGMSYGMFFALVAHDRERFDAMLSSTVKLLALDSFKGETSGATAREQLEASTAVELFIAYDLLVAYEAFEDKKYLEYAENILKRTANNNTVHSSVLGDVLLPGSSGYRTSQEFTITPAALPPFVMQKVSKYEPKFKELYHNTLQSIVRGSGDGYVADALTFNYESDLIVKSTTVGTQLGAKYYLWLGITSNADHNRKILIPLYDNITVKTNDDRFSPKLANLYYHTTEGMGDVIYDACMLPLSDGKIKDYLRTRLKVYHFGKKDFIPLMMTMFATGYDERRFELKKDGSLISETR